MDLEQRIEKLDNKFDKLADNLGQLVTAIAVGTQKMDTLTEAMRIAFSEEGFPRCAARGETIKYIQEDVSEMKSGSKWARRTLIGAGISAIIAALSGAFAIVKSLVWNS